MKPQQVDIGLITEALVHAPNFVTLQAFVKDIREQFTTVPKLLVDRLMKTADETVIGWIRDADDEKAVSYLYTSTMTLHSWPTSEKGRQKIKDACLAQWRRLGVKTVL